MRDYRIWLVTADNRRATLFACRRLPSGDMHLEQVRAIENQHEGEHERHRPTLLGGAERRGTASRSGARPAPHSTSVGHQVDEEQRRFAREVRDWIETASRDLGWSLADDRISVLAAPRLFGLLRGLIEEVDEMVSLCEGEFAQLAPHELAEHPSVRDAIKWPAPAARA